MAAPDRVRLERLTVRARLLNDPPLWCWEIVDPRTGRLAESSWERDWAAYATPREALKSGRLELIRVAALRPGVALPSRRVSSGPLRRSYPA